MYGIAWDNNVSDQATMRLRCKTCGHIMTGDYEARSHAGSSGHTDFVQDRGAD